VNIVSYDAERNSLVLIHVTSSQEIPVVIFGCCIAVQTEVSCGFSLIFYVVVIVAAVVVHMDGMRLCLCARAASGPAVHPPGNI
jgi:hypothetical protein